MDWIELQEAHKGASISCLKQQGPSELRGRTTLLLGPGFESPSRDQPILTFVWFPSMIGKYFLVRLRLDRGLSDPLFSNPNISLCGSPRYCSPH
jgi:hypothetical protein